MPKSKERQAEQGISQILAAAAHDMRQPIHSLNLLLAALAARTEDAEFAALVNKAQISADGVSGVIEALLSISTVRAGRAAPAIDEFDVAELLDHCRDQFSRQAADKGLQLRVVPCALRVRSDRFLLQRVLDILISNAIRHGEKGRVLLACRRRAGTLRIGVLDTGPGLDEQTLAGFSGAAGHGDGRTRWRGYALGLSIAQELCAAVGHDMSVYSEAERGAAVWVNVGLARTGGRNKEIPSATAKTPLENKAAIVLVEDDPDVYLATAEHLAGWGYKVFGGATAEAAIDDFEKNSGGRRPDLVLSDFKLPNSQTAVDVIAAVNRHFNSNIPALIVSGNPSAARDVAAEGLDFKILQKPIRAATLRALERDTLENGG